MKINLVHKVEKFLFLILLSILLNSCNYILCGELTGEWKNQLEKAKTFNKDFIIENIPCEFSYINLTINSNIIDTASIREIHKILYNEEHKVVGWGSILVYDSNHKYLFTHNHRGNIYVESGD